MRRGVIVALAVAVLSAVELVGCGVTPQSKPTAIKAPPGLLLSPSPEPATVPSGATPERLYFVKDGMVVGVIRKVRGVPSAATAVTDLLAGPSDNEAANNLTSALLGDRVVQTVQVSGGYALVNLATPVADTARNDGVLAYAQLVCTLSSLTSVNGVLFALNGKPIAVPRGDGSLSQDPLTAGDYAALIADP